MASGPLKWEKEMDRKKKDMNTSLSFSACFIFDDTRWFDFSEQREVVKKHLKHRKLLMGSCLWISKEQIWIILIEINAYMWW